MELLGSNPKVEKGESEGYLTGILHLAPSDLSGRNVCTFATEQCIALCLNTAGRGGIVKHGEETNTIQRARIRKTDLFFSNRAEFLRQLRADIAKLVRQASARGLRPAVRLNGTSDLRFNRLFPSLFSEFPSVRFYDYTKDAAKASEYAEGKLPANYHVTFSRSESNEIASKALISRGVNVAVVFSTKKGKALPATFHGRPVIDGDLTDLRFTDPSGVIVGLRAKGKARKAEFQGGFVVTVDRF